MSKDRIGRLELFHKIGVATYFAKFTGKPLCQSLFLIKLQAFVKKQTLAQMLSG